MVIEKTMKMNEGNDIGEAERAVLIGINYYERPNSEWPPRTNKDDAEINIKYREGCVNDILAVREYLVTTMKKPKSC